MYKRQDKVRSLKNHIAIVKENKNLTKEEKSRMIAKDKEALEKAKAVESSNKDKVSKLIACLLYTSILSGKEGNRCLHCKNLQVL